MATRHQREVQFLRRDSADPETILVVAGAEAGRSRTPVIDRVMTALQGLIKNPKAVTDNITGSVMFQRWRQGENLTPPAVDAYRRLSRPGNGNTHTGSSRLAHNTPQSRFTR